jgi:hypothetical protein
MHRRAASQRHRNSTGIPFPMGYYTTHGTSSSASASNKTLFLHLITFLRPRKTRLRATFFCLFSLVVLTTYVCLISPPVLFPSHPLHPYRAKLERIDDSWRMFAPTLKETSNPSHLAVSKPDVKLSPEQELGALTAFMAALPQNVIPSNIDPSKQIDPQLVLDFDTRKPQAEMEIDNLVVDVWLGNPVVLFAKVRSASDPPAPVLLCLIFYSLPSTRQLHSAVSRELKSILKEMDITPPPTIFDVDQRGPLCRNLSNSLLTKKSRISL